ncbi:MAG: transposase [Deltaproteobacteria bacterium RIFOXYA12_FULL_58_15]|nr:MAG: transposase [Deltaproteobacteria bacterium RIFOXYA12_FULL_58_15]
MKEVNELAKTDKGFLRISIDTKARVKVGEFARGGRNRAHVAALDHDYTPETILTPTGIFLPEYDELHIALVDSKVTSDCIVDCLDRWWTANKIRFLGVHTLLLNQDNGPENSSRRTQFIKRIIEFADKHEICVRLAYYPPYHSKYNPIERCWGVLENYWNGCLLDTVKAVREFASGMTWKGRHPTVELVTKTYETGVRLTKKVMSALEERLDRFPGLEKWFIDVVPGKPAPG